MIVTRRQTILGAAAVSTTLAFGPAFAARKPEIYLNTGGFFATAWTHAINGFDTVAYFTEGRPVPGDDAFTTEYKDASWRFASQENLDLFTADPDRYRPKYGGYCAYAVSQNSLAEGDPEVWTIYNDTLYLNVSKGIQRRWEKDKDGFIAKSEANWPSVLDR